MDIYATVQLMPYVCILGLVIVGILEEYGARKGISVPVGKSGKKFREEEGYLYTSIDDKTGNTYQFRICGDRRSGFRAYLECTPFIKNPEGLLTDAKGRQYLSAGACTRQEAEEEAEDFVLKQ